MRSPCLSLSPVVSKRKEIQFHNECPDIFGRARILSSVRHHRFTIDYLSHSGVLPCSAASYFSIRLFHPTTILNTAANTVSNGIRRF